MSPLGELNSIIFLALPVGIGIESFEQTNQRRICTTQVQWMGRGGFI